MPHTSKKEKPIKSKFQQEFLLRRKSIGKYRTTRSTRQTTRVFNTTRTIANYWARKVRDPAFHPNHHGGYRWSRFNLHDQQCIRALLWLFCNEDPTTKIAGYVYKLQEEGYQCKPDYVKRIFREWKWSWKRPSFKQLLKYTPENITKYGAYVEWIALQDLSKMKFMDEVHFVAKSVSQSKSLGPVGDKVVLLRGEHFNKTYSISAIVSLDEDPIYIQARDESNDQMDFLSFVVKALSDGYLKPGDILVMDNCGVHGGLETFDLLQMLLEIHDVQLAYLPAYSPEFNPCELVFAQVKRFLREHRDQKIPLIVDIAAGFAIVNSENVRKYYNKCCRAL